MLLGEFNHSIDTKNRVFIPAKFREEFGDTMILVKGVDRCISVYSSEEWQKFSAKLDALPEIDSRRVKRFIYASASEVQPDAQGRVIVTQSMREYAALDKNVVIIGVGNHAEIWDEALWNNEIEFEDQDSVASVLKGLGF